MKRFIKKGNTIATPAFAVIEPNFNKSRENSISMFNYSEDTLLIEGQNEYNRQALSFIEEFAFGDKSKAMQHLMERAHQSDSISYEIDDEAIYQQLASLDHQDAVISVLSNPFLDLESIA